MQFHTNVDFPIFETIKPPFDVQGLEEALLYLLCSFGDSLLLEVAGAIVSAWPNLTFLDLGGDASEPPAKIHVGIIVCPSDNSTTVD